MEKYYVSGCRDDGETIVTCDDSEAIFWTLYARDDKGLSQAMADFTHRVGAEAAMQVYIMRDAHFAAEMVWEKTMMETIGEDGVGSVKAAIERLQAERDALQEQVQKLAAEGDALKNFIRNSCYAFAGDDVDISDSYVSAKESPWLPKTTNTDAVIREIGAKAVEGFGNVLGLGSLHLALILKKCAYEHAAKVHFI